jgi:hypothetical protein
MQTTEPTNQKIKALALKATEIKQASDHCSGESETWSEVSFDTFARMLVEECVGVIEHHCAESNQDLVNAKSLKIALLAHFGLA